MSNPPPTPTKRCPNKKRCLPKNSDKIMHEDNNNLNGERLKTRNFVTWYENLIDSQRSNLTLYLTNDIVLEWFGKTIRTRKKVSGFLKYDMQCTRHDFTSFECIDKIETRPDNSMRKLTLQVDEELANPLDVQKDISCRSAVPQNRKRPLPRVCNSPQWENKEAQECSDVKKSKHCSKEKVEPQNAEINYKGDGVLQKGKSKEIHVTPPSCELGQGDCLPSTSESVDMSHLQLTQLQKKAVECNCYIEFTRVRNNRSSDSMKWDRKCKLQISYSEDPVNVGEYLIWAIHYTDDSSCRRNLLAAFEEVAREEELKKGV